MVNANNYGEDMNKSSELVHLMRKCSTHLIGAENEYVDLIHYGSIAVANTKGDVIYAVGDPNRQIFLRSSAKPLQAIATAESGALEKFGINEQELAIMCGSHAGQDVHVQTVMGILAKIGLTEDALQCAKNNPARDNCSGKHSGILALCRYYGFPVDNYLEPDHPAQTMIRKVIGEMCDVDAVKYGVDGCGIPTSYIPLANTAIGFARLANPGDLEQKRKEAIIKISAAMQAYPLMTGEIRSGMTWPKEIVAKSGALGVYCGGIRHKDTGIALKIDDGSHLPCAFVFTEVLKRLSLADKKELDSYQELSPPIERNRRGDIVAKMEIVF